jgi:hypothetical protein
LDAFYASVEQVPLRVDGNLTDVVTHIYKPSTSGVTRLPLVIYSHGRPLNPNPPNIVSAQQSSVKEQLVQAEILMLAFKTTPVHRNPVVINPSTVRRFIAFLPVLLCRKSTRRPMT